LDFSNSVEIDRKVEKIKEKSPITSIKMLHIAPNRANSSSQMISFYRSFHIANQTFSAQPSDPLTQSLNPFTCEALKGLAETREQYGNRIHL